MVETMTYLDYILRPFFRSSDLSLVPASDEDADYVLDLRRRLLGPYIDRHMGGWFDPDQQHWLDNHFEPEHAKLIRRFPADIGTIGLYPDGGGTVWLRHFYIESDHQGMGFGSDVLRRIHRATDEFGIEIQLKVIKDSPATRLYRRHGYELVEELDHQFRLHREPQRPTSVQLQQGSMTA